MRIFGLVGSVSRNSANSELLHGMAAVSGSFEVQIWQALDRLPYFRPDVDGDPELVSSGELYGKPIVGLSAAPSAQRSGNARRWVEETIRMQGAEIVDSFAVVVPPGASLVVVQQAAETALTRTRESTRHHRSPPNE